LLKGFARILLKEFNSARLRKEEDRNEERFKIFAGFIGISDNILFIFSLKMFWAFRLFRFFIFLIIGGVVYAGVGFSFRF
jgi:hypothetical protein